MSPRRRSSFLEGDDYVQVDASGGNFMRRCYSHNPSPTRTPLFTGHRQCYVPMNTAPYRAPNGTLDINNFDSRRRSTSLLRNSGKNITNLRPNSSYYSPHGDNENNDSRHSATRGVTFSRKNSIANGSNSVHSLFPKSKIY